MKKEKPSLVVPPPLQRCRGHDSQNLDWEEVVEVPRNQVRPADKRARRDDGIRCFHTRGLSYADGLLNNRRRNRDLVELGEQIAQSLLVFAAKLPESQNLESRDGRESNPVHAARTRLPYCFRRSRLARERVNQDVRVQKPAHQAWPHCFRSRSSHSARSSRSYASPSTFCCMVPSKLFI